MLPLSPETSSLQDHGKETPVIHKPPGLWRFITGTPTPTLKGLSGPLSPAAQRVNNFWSCWYCSVTKSCPTLCNPVDCSMSGFPVLHYLPEFAQIHVIESLMPSNPLILRHPFLPPSIFPSISIFLMSSLFASSSKYIGALASVLPMNIQGWFPLERIGLIS